MDDEWGEKSVAHPQHLAIIFIFSVSTSMINRRGIWGIDRGRDGLYHFLNELSYICSWSQQMYVMNREEVRSIYWAEAKRRGMTHSLL